MTEDRLEQECLSWLADVGWQHRYGPDIAPDGAASARESVQAKLRLMVKRILRKYKYPPDQQEAAVELVLHQAKVLGEPWG